MNWNSKTFVDALRYNLAVTIAKEYWAMFLEINPSKEYGGETDEAYKDVSKKEIFEEIFEKENPR